MENCRIARLTRNQHVLFKLGELIAWAECAGALCLRARDGIEKGLDEKADTRFPAGTLCAMARVMAQDTAMKVATEGMKVVTGAQNEIPAGFIDSLRLGEIIQSQAGAIEDMNTIAAAIYDRGT